MSIETVAVANSGTPPPNDVDDLIETPEELAERVRRARERPRSDRPIPSVQCTYVRNDGSRCLAYSLRGATVCIAHGARLPNVRAAAARRVEEAKVKLGLNAPGAVDVIVAQMTDPETPAYVRQQAAFGLLDRAGIGPGHKTEVEVSGSIEHTHSVEAASRIRGTLQRYSDTAAEVETVEAEVVEDSP